MKDLKTLKERNFKAALAHAVENGIPFFPEVGDELLPTAELPEFSHIPNGYSYQGYIMVEEVLKEIIWDEGKTTKPRLGFACRWDNQTLYPTIWTKE